jgi:hypothetical protein
VHAPPRAREDDELLERCQERVGRVAYGRLECSPERAAVKSAPYGPTVTIRAVEGTPFPFTRKSI